MPMAYDPSDRAISKVQHAVAATGDPWFIPTPGYGDNPNSGTDAQQLAQCNLMSGKKADGSTDIAEELVES